MPARTVLTFGELLLRLDTPGQQRFLQAEQFRSSFTGGEANVAVALSGWGVPARILSRVPANAIGDACLNHFRRYGVDTSLIVRGGDRLGLLFVETGASQRPPQVIYDRDHSAFRALQSADIDWDRALADTGWLHFTGTAPAVGDTIRQTLRAALEQARLRGLRVSFDCSYRSALWSPTEAADVLPPLMDYVDVFVGSESDARQFFGISESGADCLHAFRDQFDFKCVAFTRRTVCPSGHHRYAASVCDRRGTHNSREYEIDVVDRIGAGDAFAAGLIFGLLNDQPLRQMTEFAVAASVLAHSIPGDFALLSVDEVEHLVADSSPTRGWR